MRDDFTSRQSPLSGTPATEGQRAGEESQADSLDLTGAPGPEAPRYRILGLVGTGGMGVVYRAEDNLLGRMVALKFLHPTLTPNPRAKMRFLDEGRGGVGSSSRPETTPLGAWSLPSFPIRRWRPIHGRRCASWAGRGRLPP